MYEPKNGRTYRHSNVIDWMLANPELPLREAQDATGFTPQYLYTLRRSDMFRAEYERRRAELEAALHVEMVDKWAQVEDELLEKVLNKLRGPVTEKFLIAGLDSLTNRTKVAQHSPVVNVQVNSFMASPEDIRRARERAAELTRGRSQDITILPGEPRGEEPGFAGGKYVAEAERLEALAETVAAS
jgi:hypothetical protein